MIHYHLQISDMYHQGIVGTHILILQKHSLQSRHYEYFDLTSLGDTEKTCKPWENTRKLHFFAGRP